MIFVHEFVDYPNAKNIDNGYWEYQDGMCYNRYGGRHLYHEHPLSSFLEANSWDDILPIMIRDDSQITGWLAPNGEFFGCAPTDHLDLEDYVIKKDARLLEKEGWIKIYEVPWQLRDTTNQSNYSYFGARHPTPQQQEVLRDKGIYIEDYRW